MSTAKIKMNVTNLPSRRAYDDYLKQFVNKESPNSPTNTRIGDKKKIDPKIFGAAYHIPDEKYSEFLTHYADRVFSKNEPEYLTEKQLDTDGPIYVDLDFHFNYDVTQRIIGKEHIVDLIETYLEELKKMFQFDEQSFYCFIMQKQTVNRLADKTKTKDGIHMMICIQADRTMQIVLRDNVMKKISEMWEDLPIINRWDDVFDEGITIGHTNCQLFGSRKPDHDAYQLTYVYDVKYDKNDSQFSVKPIKLNAFDVQKNIDKLSVRNNDIPVFFMKNEFSPIYNEYKSVRQGGNPKSSRTVTRPAALTTTFDFDDISNLYSNIKKISSAAELDILVNLWRDNISKMDYDVKEAFEYADILPACYYEDGSYSKWMRVGWALKNVDNKLLIAWIKLSSKAKNFNYSTIPEICDKWHKMDMRKSSDNGVTKRSLMHWAKQDARNEYAKIHQGSIDSHIENSITGTNHKLGGGDKANKGECGDFELAMVLNVAYGDGCVCTSIKSNIWYQYDKNRWTETDSGTTLRKKISTEMREMYSKRANGHLNGQLDVATPTSVASNDSDEEQSNIRKIISQRILNICQRLNRTSDKKNIMTEAKDLFYDGNFLNKLDTNPHLLCFNNGVIDFNEKIFRKGRPDDYISLCTNIDYIPIDVRRDAKVIEEIKGFMSALFPDKELYDYMFDYLASTLIGTTTNQTFNMFIGGGSNGKSKLIDLMKLVLGDYKGDVPLALVTGERTKIGGLSPEVVQLKGVRFAVMQEPSKGDKINEGKMKELTGGDSIQARAPYMLQAVSFNPQFKLAVCANTMMEIKSNDHGTWRRIRVVPFKSLFTETPVDNDKEKPYQFKLNKDIDKKFVDWKEVFAAMLVEHAFKTNGNVKDCPMVMMASNEYRQSQDYIAEFIRDKVTKDVHGKIKKNELNNEFQTWYMSTYGRGGPNVKDIHEYMDKQFGKQREQAWVGVKIRYERDDFVMPNVDNNDDDIDDIGVDNL